MPFITYNATTGAILNYSSTTVGLSSPYISITDKQWADFIAEPVKYSVINGALTYNNQYDSSLGVPILPITNITHALYRNLNDTQTNVTTKTRLLIDGNGVGGFNTIGLNLYDVATGKIKPTSLNQCFILRISFVITPTVAGTLFNLTIDVPAGLNTGSTILINKYTELSCLKPIQFMESYPLYVGPGFLESGGIIYISADRPVAITRASVYIIRLI